MCADEVRRSVPHGFIKSTGTSRPAISGEQKAQLIRRGNELFNEGKYETAERIYIATGYSDGMVRMGDVHFKSQRYREAMRLYQLAPAPDRVQKLAKRMALVVQQWLIEEAKADAALQRVAVLSNKEKPAS